MESDNKPVRVAESCGSFEAKVLVGVLQAAGIRALTSTGPLMDEFAMAQAMMNNVDVFVAKSDLERAQAAIVEAREAGKFLEEDT